MSLRNHIKNRLDTLERPRTLCQEELRARARHLQKVVDLCIGFLANLAYYRTGWDGPNRRFTGEPYRRFNANCFEHVYLDWSKLFGNRNEQHHWRQVVTNPNHFKAGLLEELECDEAAYGAFWKEMQEVRDRVVAHQDIFEEIPTPRFDKAFQSANYLLNYIYDNEIGREIKLAYRYDSVETYERFRRWGETFWNGDEPLVEDCNVLTIRTVRLEEDD